MNIYILNFEYQDQYTRDSYVVATCSSLKAARQMKAESMNGPYMVIYKAPVNSVRQDWTRIS